MSTQATQETTTAVERLAKYIEIHGPIKTARVSSAQASGRAKQYPYWGAVRYQIRLRKADGMPVNVALERASSDRRSARLAEKDMLDLCDREGRIHLDRIGLVRESDAERILRRLGED